MSLLKLVFSNIFLCVAFASSKIALEVGRCGEDTKIVCSGTDTFAWNIRKNGYQIAGKGSLPDTTKYSVREYPTNVVLTIHNTSVNDGGSYNCEVANDGRSETKDLQLNCSLSFVISSQILSNETVTLKCYTASDSCILQTYFGSKFVGAYDSVLKELSNQDPTKYEVFREMSQSITTLTINIRQFSSNDVGTYTCRDIFTSETKEVFLSLSESSRTRRIVVVVGGIVVGVVALAVAVMAYFQIPRRYRFPCRHTSDSASTTVSQSNPVSQEASSNEHLTTSEQTEYTEIGMTAVGPSSAGSLLNETTSYERLHNRENAAYVDLESCQRQYVNQHPHSQTAGSNYEIPNNQESSMEPRDYDNGTNPKHTQVSATK
ncbi:uncharacterized protein LOC128233681 isoform X2 [Mya arenaria]|uniref:uncharacterized protein LOC128233681 isoform X2 n=1 Tax=Mya arenaria TaxID=6604 RepID=UPI0022E4DDB8|nr:uncharacterized protein LOC128233681 isoform X2 [Mya arenaria]